MADLNIYEDTITIPSYSIPDFNMYYFIATGSVDTRSNSGYVWLQSFPGITSSITIVQESRYLNSTHINTLFALVASDSNEYSL